jgi:hypothetical protein
VGNDVTTGPIMYKEDMKNRAEQKIVVEKQDYCRVLFAGISLQHETHVLYSYSLRCKNSDKESSHYSTPIIILQQQQQQLT